MPIYATDQQLYSCFKALFGRIEKEDREAEQELLKSKMSIRFRCSEPTADILIDAENKPLQIVYGSHSKKPTLDIALSADTLHEILLGNLKLSKALGSKRLKPKGPVWKSFALEPLLHQAQKVYPEILKACNP
ncbi:MAG: SCP2 sterol-binding domain-containing protein [Candidatus Promineifilaceae bacterium]|nr:SCP2 sterol-binding domain-containing protein [Candidatus Promineifilaceae bacterium]